MEASGSRVPIPSYIASILRNASCSARDRANYSTIYRAYTQQLFIPSDVGGCVLLRDGLIQPAGVFNTTLDAEEWASGSAERGYLLHMIGCEPLSGIRRIDAARGVCELTLRGLAPLILQDLDVAGDFVAITDTAPGSAEESADVPGAPATPVSKQRERVESLLVATPCFASTLTSGSRSEVMSS